MTYISKNHKYYNNLIYPRMFLNCLENIYVTFTLIGNTKNEIIFLG